MVQNVTKKISGDISSELVIYSSEVSAMDLQIPVSSQYYMYAVDLYNNKDIILNSVSHLTERNNTITIRKMMIQKHIQLLHNKTQ